MDFEIRLLEESDSLEELIALLHRAYKRLADMGLQFVATHQGDDTTLDRIRGRGCYVIQREGKIIGTACFAPPDLAEGCDWYEQAGVAKLSQFAVEPELQGLGIGSRMMEFVENRAREVGARELALDTSEHAHHLIDFYGKRGYRFVQHAQWPDVNYRSVVMSKSLDNGTLDE
ncbi:MAG TPA: GNAT family N-acetyltransferase [Fimbriimonadaceae bacterium]|nr:GNAT family N-acetyltransferase [Fimbriimonadaceae bacterium]